MSTQTQDDITQPIDQPDNVSQAAPAVEPPAQAEVKEPAAPAAPEPEAQPEGGEKPQHGVQKRIDEVTKARREAEREAAYWKNVAQGSGKDSGAEKPAAQEKPTPDKFASYDEYLEALTDWKAEQRIQAVLDQRQQQEHRQQSAQTFQGRVQEFKATAEDFDTVIAGVADIQVSPEVQDLLMASEHGPQIVYELAKNPEDARRIASLPPVLAAREIGRIEARLSAAQQAPTAAAAPAAPATPPVTKAPAPIQPSRSAAGQFTKDPAAQTDAEWWESQHKPR